MFFINAFIARVFLWVFCKQCFGKKWGSLFRLYCSVGMVKRSKCRLVIDMYSEKRSLIEVLKLITSNSICILSRVIDLIENVNILAIIKFGGKRYYFDML